MTYAFDTTDEQEDAITYKRLQFNAVREKEGIPPLEDNGSYVGYFVMTTIIGPLVAEFVEASVQPLSDLIRKASYDDRKAVEKLLTSGR